MADGRRFSVIPITVASDTSLSLLTHRVATVLGCHMSRAGVCYPSVETIAAAVPTSVRSARRSLEELIAKGHLERRRRYNASSLLVWIENGQRSGYSESRINGQGKRVNGQNRGRERPRMDGRLNVVNEERKNGEPRSYEREQPGQQTDRERAKIPSRPRGEPTRISAMLGSVVPVARHAL